MRKIDGSEHVLAVEADTEVPALPAEQVSQLRRERVDRVDSRTAHNVRLWGEPMIVGLDDELFTMETKERMADVMKNA